jgi:hypothetical protein
VSRVFHIRLLVTVLFATVCGGAASSCVKLTGIHNGCAVTADCDPGRQCVAGVCQAGGVNGDASVSDSADSGSLEAPPMGDGSGGGPEIPDASGKDVPIVLPDAGPIGEVHEDVPVRPPGQDAFDSQPESPGDATDATDGRDATDARDASDGNDVGDVRPDNGPRPPDCELPPKAEPDPARSSLPHDLAGTWQVCGDVSGASADILWLLGGTRTIHLDGTVYWGRVAAGTAFQGNQDGMYFQILEGTRSILQFLDVNVATGKGATLAVNYFSAQGVVDLTSCDGAVLCGPSVVRLVRAGDGGAGP